MCRIKKIKIYFRYAVLGISLAFICLLLIPIGILATLIYLIWSVTDRIIYWCEKGERDEF
ncbi:hypothetical protein DXC23_06720 [Eubacterium sp. OM08-24]|nr:hypothetical protein DXC23_06720 [Eubacterium sp. OM08-24]